MRTDRILAAAMTHHFAVALVEERRLVHVEVFVDEDSPRRRTCFICRGIEERAAADLRPWKKSKKPVPRYRRRCPHTVDQSAQAIRGLLGAGLDLADLDLAVIERPSSWRPGYVSPNLGQGAGLVAGALATLGVNALLLSPADWKGSATHTRCYHRTLAVLDKAERALLPLDAEDFACYDSDAISAAGLAMWTAGRLDVHETPGSALSASVPTERPRTT